MKIIESQLRNIIRQELMQILQEKAPDIANLKTTSEIEMCDYDLSVPGIKIFLTLPSPTSGKEQFRNRVLIQGRDIVRNIFKGNLSAASVHHVGFVFNDKTTLEPIVFIPNNPTITPDKCIILLIKGTTKAHEDAIRQRGEDLIKFHENMETPQGQRYNYAGLVEKIPFIGSILKNVAPRKLNTYYCSQLVADLLATVGVVTVEQLKKAKSLSETQEEIYENSALSPSELYDMIKDKAEVLQPACL